jgi:hypothetical protein
MYAPSDFVEITIPEDVQGCGHTHRRPEGPDGRPLQPWRLECEACGRYLRDHDDRWSPDADGIRETFDEKIARERFLEKGRDDHAAITALAMSRMAGLSPAEIPATIQQMIAGVKVRIPGETLCPQGSHPNTPGSRYCSSCGAAMTVPAPAPELPAGPAQ